MAENQEHYHGECSFPPPVVLQSVLDTFFLHYCERYNAYLLDSSLFRERFEAGIVPEYLILAILAAGVPLSADPYYEESKLRAAKAYARASWLSVSNEAPKHPTIEAVQTLGLLARLDSAAGLVTAGMTKATLVVKVCQALQLTAEPPSYLSFAEQEERRRVFWSIYVQEKVYVGGKSRPYPGLWDDECTLQLPCDDETFRAGLWQGMLTVGDLISWDSQATEVPNSSSLAILMVSVYGRCMKYVRCDGLKDPLPPWDTRSGFYKIKMLLLQVESRFQTNSQPDVEKFRNCIAFSQENALVALFGRITFHLCQCLTSHPFFVRQISKPFEAGLEPAIFTMGCLDTANDHARQLLDLIDERYKANGFGAESSSYAYWLVVAGSVLSLVAHVETSKGHTEEAAESSHFFQRSIETLHRLGRMWPQAVNMRTNLCRFHAHHSYAIASSLESLCAEKNIDPAVEEAFAALLDHEMVASPAAESSDDHVEKGTPRSRLSDSSAWTAASWDRDSNHYSYSGSSGSSTVIGHP